MSKFDRKHAKYDENDGIQNMLEILLEKIITRGENVIKYMHGTSVSCSDAILNSKMHACMPACYCIAAFTYYYKIAS